MKYLVYILILLFTSPAFAGGFSSAFDGANALNEEPAAIQGSPVVEPEAEFKIDERLYFESMGPNDRGGFYAEESYLSDIAFYTVSSHGTDFGLGTGFVVVKDQLIPINLGSSFLVPFNLGGVFLPGGIGIHVGGFSFVHGGLGFRHR